MPNERSLHNIPTPRLGGLAIVLTWYPGISSLFYYNVIESQLYYALMCGALISLISLIDDLIGVFPAIRLFIHFSASILAFYFLNGLRHFVFPGIDINYPFIIYPLVILGMVWFINLFNFMDGIDGLASNEAITIALVLFFFSGNVINLLLIACISGFLFWNWPKAKIFMGDIGSTQLGFILIVLGLYFHNNFKLSILNWIMLAGPFWFDATFTLFRRWRNAEKLSHAHKKHAYQRIVQAGYSHQKVNMLLFFINVLVFLIIVLYRKYDIVKIPLTLLTLFSFYLLYRKVDKRIPF
jgi:UDP-N-acetylmuramyl pentapeptide phosphotransferase/UDP-N-acetylglucosamine-1-phosphate transferase